MLKIIKKPKVNFWLKQNIITSLMLSNSYMCHNIAIYVQCFQPIENVKLIEKCRRQIVAHLLIV